MSFLISCIFYSFFGSLTGFFTHIFNGIIQEHIVFDTTYSIHALKRFLKVLAVMTLASLASGLVIISIPTSFYTFLRVDHIFFQEIILYLFAFAAFDFGLRN